MGRKQARRYLPKDITIMLTSLIISIVGIGFVTIVSLCFLPKPVKWLMYNMYLVNLVVNAGISWLIVYIAGAGAIVGLGNLIGLGIGAVWVAGMWSSLDKGNITFWQTFKSKPKKGISKC